MRGCSGCEIKEETNGGACLVDAQRSACHLQPRQRERWQANPALDLAQISTPAASRCAASIAIHCAQRRDVAAGRAWYQRADGSPRFVRLVSARAAPHIRGMTDSRSPRRQHAIAGALLALPLAVGCSATDRTTDAATPPAQLELPGAMFYPESITATADGRLLVGSFGTGEVAAYAAGATAPSGFVATSPDVKRALGVLADDARGALWMCADDTATTQAAPPQLRRYDLSTGAFRASYGFPAAAFCNDLALDGQHNLYVTDSLGAVYRLAAGADHLEVWSRDPLLAPSAPGGFGANGVAWDGATSVYVTSFSDNRLIRIAIRDDGSAAPATQIAVTPALVGPDALRALDPGALLVVEQTGGRLTRVTVPDGRATPIADHLDMPTSVAIRGRDAWVTEGQLGHILGSASGPPSLPFVVRRIALP
jgi:sugar lactone lactonase YvrE